MSEISKQAVSYCVNGRLIEEQRHRIIYEGEEYKLEPKNMQVLLYLIAHQGQTVSKEELLQHVWPGVVVSEQSLNQAISKLRRVLGDDSKNPRVIETIPKKGYRLVAAVEKVHKNGVNGGNGEAFRVISSQEQKAPVAKRPAKLPRIIFFFASMVGVALLAFMFRQRPSQYSKAESKLIPLTASPGVERFPAFSPDGRSVAYIQGDPCAGTTEVFIKSNDETSARQLTARAGTKNHPRFSPDGSVIAFVNAFNGKAEILTVPVAGGATTKVVNAFGASLQGMDWSPEGDLFAYADRPTPDEPFQIYLFSLREQKRTQLTAPALQSFGDKLPRFSVDGKQIAFARVIERGNEDVYLLAREGGSPIRLTHEGGAILGLAWAPDGKSIVYCYHDYRDEEYKMAQIETTGRRLRVLHSSAEFSALNPALSEQAGLLAFERANYPSKIFHMRLDSIAQDAPRLEPFANSTRSDWHPEFSPNGEQVAFFSARTGVKEIWLADREGRHLKKLAANAPAFNSAPPRWSPDGRFLAVEQMRDGARGIYLVAFDGSEQKLVVNDGRAPTFSRDGEWIYFSSQRSGIEQIWKVPFGGGEPMPVTRNGGYLGFESSDGKEFYFVKGERYGLWKISENQEEKLLFKDLAPAHKLNWRVVDHGIFYLGFDKEENTVLRFYDFAKQEATLLATLPRQACNNIFSLSIAPDLRTALLSRNEPLEIDILTMAWRE